MIPNDDDTFLQTGRKTIKQTRMNSRMKAGVDLPDVLIEETGLKITETTSFPTFLIVSLTPFFASPRIL